MAKAKKETDGSSIEIEMVTTSEMDFCLKGARFLFNRLAEKARHELLLPSPKKNAAERAMKLKHNPIDEFRASVYASRDDDAPTRLIFPGGAFRKAIASAALDIPGATKAQIGRLVRVTEFDVSIYGTPTIYCAIVRNSDMRHTPDVRTCALLKEWACSLTLRFPHPMLKEKTIVTLLAAAGDFIGVGDGRNEKGSSLSCGCFEIVPPTDPDFLRIKAQQGRAAQDAALLDPESFDAETSELLGWFDAELTRRDQQPASSRNSRKKEAVL